MNYATWALGEAVGPALVLDDQLRIRAWTPGADTILGMEPELGVSAPRLLCGHGEERPLAEALAEKRAIRSEILRPTPDGENRVIRVSASHFDVGDGGWLLVLEHEEMRDADGGTSEAFGIITRDPAMKELLTKVRKVAKSDASVLVRGQTGAGKELIARAIHSASPRSDGPFRAINCAALPPNLLESALFGHVRGSFTGAVRDEPGHFRLAERGTLMLDEVAELPLAVQAKLLRVLQERTVIPVGGRDAIPVDVRIVSATHRALRREVEAGRFRADLLYRLRVIPLYLPSLEERPEDIEVLAWHFLERQRHREVRRITSGALDVLLTYRWPGNVRELQNVIEYATVMGEGTTLTEADLPPEVRGGATDGVSITRPDPKLRELRAGLQGEGRRLLNALERSGGHMSRAAASLGMSRTTLWRKLKKHGLDKASLGDAEG